MSPIVKRIREKPHLLGHLLGYDLLTDVHSKWILYIWKNKKDRSLQAHRNSYKTTAIVVVGAIWYWLFHPNTRILICRKEFTGASKTLKEIAKHLKGETIRDLVQEIYGRDDFAVIQDTAEAIETNLRTRITKESSFECTGVGSSKTGAHHDRIHTDDIITVEDRFSPAKREQTKNFVDELVNLCDPTGCITHTGTPWHEDDAWNKLPEPIKYPLYSVKVKGLTESKIKRIKMKITASLFAANYELTHIPGEGRMFDDPIYEPMPKRIGRIAHLDAKYGGKDLMALTIGGFEGSTIYARGWLFKTSVVDNYSRIVSICNEMQAGRIYLEDNADKGLSANEFLKLGLNTGRYHESLNKHLKIERYLYRYWKKMLWDPATDSEYMKYILSYEMGKEPDDPPDSAASFIRALNFHEDDVDLDEELVNNDDYINDYGSREEYF